MSKVPSPSVPLWLPALAIAAPLCAPLVNFLAHHEFPLLSLPVGVIFLFIAALALVAGWFELGGPRFLAALPLAFAVAFSVDYLLAIPFFRPDAIRVATLSLVIAAVFAFNYLARPNSYKVVAFIFSMMALATVAQTALFGPGDAEPTPEVPSGDFGRVIVHLILDEHIGLEGMPLDIEGGPRARKMVEDFYARHGFRLHSRAYSRHFGTKNSLSSTLNYSSSAERGLYLSRAPRVKKLSLSTNAYFDGARERGFDIHVYQSEFLKLCDPGAAQTSPDWVRRCYAYPSNSIRFLAPLDLGSIDKAAFVLRSFVQESFLQRSVRKVYSLMLRPRLYSSLGVALPSWGTEGHRVGPIPVRGVLNDLTADATTPQGDVMVVGHLLMPHYPYVFRRDCELRSPATTWLGRDSADVLHDRRSGGQGTPSNDEASRRVRYERYFEQLECLYSDLDDLMDALESTIPGEVTVVIHGDHGSRINLYDPNVKNDLSLLRDSDLLDGYSTMFAIKGPGVDAGIEPEPAALDQLLPMRPAAAGPNVPSNFFFIEDKSKVFERIDRSPFDGVAGIAE